MLMLLAEVVTAEDVRALHDKVGSLIWIVIFVSIAACAYFGTNALKRRLAAQWAKIRSDLTLGPATTLDARPTAQPSLRASAGYDAAAQTLLQIISCDASVRATVMTVEKSDGTYKLEFTAKGGAANG